MGKTMANHIIKRHRTYFAHLIIPKDVRKVLGKAKFSQSLKTESLTEALRLAPPVVAYWKTLIDKARGDEGQVLNSQAMIWRDLMRKATSDIERQEIKSMIVDEAYEVEEKVSTEKAHEFVAMASGNATPILDHLDVYLKDQAVGAATEAQRRREVKHLAEHFKTAEQVTRREASNFLRNVLDPGRKSQTVNRIITTYRTYWDWLIDNGYLAEGVTNPWQRQNRRAKRNEVRDRRPYTQEEAIKVLELTAQSTNRYPDDLAIMRLLAVSGLRIEEACSLVPGQVRKAGKVRWIEVLNGKTSNAKRRVPVVDPVVIADLDARMSGERIFETLTSDPNGRYGPGLTRRMSYRIRKITDDVNLVAAHSWRHRAATLLEQGGIQPWIAATFLGHARSGMTLGTYSKGASDEQLLECARVLPLP